MSVQVKEEILEKLRSIVKENLASNDDAVRIAYSRDQMVTSDGPDYVVAPESTEQIQEIMRLATKYKIPVLPKGTGANMGGLVIPLTGGIILDLKLMNTIHEIDVKNMTATLGPGVTYGQLQIEAYNRGLFVVVPSGPHTVRVIANVCGTRGIGHYAGKYGLGDNQIIGMEIVLPNGNLLKLGSFAHGKGEYSANVPHSPGPDLMGLFLGGFGTVGVITKIKVKLYPKYPQSDLIAIAGALDPLFDESIFLVKLGYSNLMQIRWPYIAILAGRNREESLRLLKQQLIEGFSLIFIEGTKREFDYHVKRLKKIYKKRKGFTPILYSEMMDTMSRSLSVDGEYTENDQEFGYMQERRKFHDFMFQSVRILRLHGGFAPHCPFFSLKDAKATWNYMKNWITKIGGPIEETCCYFQVTDDGHTILQEMDLEFNPDPNKMGDNIKSFIGIGKPIVDTMFVKRNGIQYYFYPMAGSMLENIGPILIPGFWYLSKKFKTLIDPLYLMNRGRGIYPEGFAQEDLQIQSFGSMSGMDMGSMYWFQILGSVINNLHLDKKEKLVKLIEDLKNKKIGEEYLQEILQSALNSAVSIILNDKTRATVDESLGEFFKRNYIELIGEKVVIKSDVHNLWIIEFNSLENSEPIRVYTVEKKEARGIPYISTDFVFARKALSGEEVDPLLSMLKPDEGKFGIMESIMRWLKGTILKRFSNVVTIGAITLLYRENLMEQLNTRFNNKIDSILSKLNY